jgi:hypothetical protein
MLNKNNLILNEYSDDYFIVGSSHTKVKNKFAEKYKKEDEYLITDNVHGKVLVDGPEILYRINKDGFRSQHFQNFNKDKKNILVAGCSVSFGEGILEELTWHQEMLNNIEFDEYYNISSIGASTRLIVKNILTFIRKNGKPEYIFAIFPNFSRDLQFDSNSKEFISCIINRLLLLAPKEYMTNNIYIKNYQHEYAVFTYIDYIRILEDVCEYLNIKLIWSTWDDEAKYILNDLKFKYYFNMNCSFAFNGKKPYFKITKNINNLPYWESSKDGYHPGSCWNTLAGKEFYEEFLRRKYDC